MPDFHDVIPGTQISAGQASLAELQAAMASGQLSSAALTSFYLERIDRLNPALHAVITVSFNAAAEAAASDASRAAHGSRGPLDGIPVLVKDNVQVAGMPTTAGSPALLPAEPDDAFVVARLRQAGAVIIGKANLSEWANFRSTHSTSGWSTLGGQTGNPYALDRNPSGSSSGSAAGVAAALAPVAVGTETDGSIVCPAPKIPSRLTMTIRPNGPGWPAPGTRSPKPWIPWPPRVPGWGSGGIPRSWRAPRLAPCWTRPWPRCAHSAPSSSIR